MPPRILTAEISHETNTFNIRPTDIAAFRDRYLLDGPAAIATRGSSNTELAGVLETGQRHGWDITHVISAAAGPGGRVTDAAFEDLCKPLMRAAAQGGWDGILLMLHGAMVTASHDDAEGEILRRVRQSVGPDLPIAVTLDPHANVSTAMCDLAQILVSFTTYPHVDIRATGCRAAELLHRAIVGDIHPRTLRAHRPMLEETNGGRTDIGPMIERHAMARASEAADIAATWKLGSGPLVVADYADNPGSGAYGDATALLRALLEAGVKDTCYGPMIDAEAAAYLQTKDIGSTQRLELGGKTAPEFGGGPLEVTGVLTWRGIGHVTGSGPILGGLQRSFGPTAVLDVQGIAIFVVSIPHQMLDLRQFETFGIRPAVQRVIALKSMQQFRATFAPIAGRIIICDSGALCTVDYSKMTYSKVPRPVYPLDDEYLE